MENWCLKMGFKHDDVDKFCKDMKGHCQPRVKIVWNHIIKHVLPKNEANVIRRQHLFNILQTSKCSKKVEVSIRSIKDYKDYMKYKKDECNLKSLQEEIATKKTSIKVHLSRLESSRGNSITEEEELKEKVYKLSQLKNKKITITRLINKLLHNGKMLYELKEPRNIVGFDTNVTKLDQQVITLINELPQGLEYQTLLSNLIDLKSESKLPPVQYWDRTEVLTTMENLLLSLNEKLRIAELEFANNENRIQMKVDSSVPLILEKCDDVNAVDEARLALCKCKEDFLFDGETTLEKLCLNDEKYILEIQFATARRLHRLIAERQEEICSFLDFKWGELADNGTSHIELPSQLPISKLLNSLNNEVSVFMKMPLSASNLKEANLHEIHTGCTSESEYLNLKNNLKKLIKLLNLLDNLSSLKFSCAESQTVLEFKKIMTELHNDTHFLESCRELLAKVNHEYQRLKSGLMFWREEPLNKRLTGFQVDGFDIKELLVAYGNIKEQLDNEKWIFSDMQNIKP